MKRLFSIHIIWVIILLALFACCSSSGSQETGSSFADDDDYLPDPDDDSGPDDDTVPDDDDTTPDDDDTTPDDDDTTPDDDDTTPDDDDTTPDDDDDDDDTTFDPPEITIIEPTQGTVYTSSEIIVSVIVTGALPADITPKLDGNDVSAYLTISDLGVEGTLGGLSAGGHNFSVTAVNNSGSETEQVNFQVDIQDPLIDLTLPAGPVQIDTDVEAEVVVYDENGADITGSVTINWEVTPNTGFSRNGLIFNFQDRQTWTITASCLYGGDTLTDTEQIESTDLVPDSLQIGGPTEVTAGQLFALNVAILNQFGETLDPSIYTITFDVNPSAGVTINGNIFQLTVAAPHTITVTANGGKYTVNGDHDVNVIPGAPFTTSLTLTDYSIECYETVGYQAAVVDYYGNPTTEPYTISTNPTDGVVIDTINQEITFNRAGAFVVSCMAAGYPPATRNIDVNDSIDPKILWDDPACQTTPRGTWTSATSFTLYGRVIENESDLVSFTINDNPVTYNPTTGCFVHNVMLDVGLNFFFAQAEDSFANTARANISVLRGANLPHGQVVDYAIGIRVNQSSLTTIENIANGLLALLDLENLIMTLIPQINETIFPGVTVQAGVSGANIGDPIITLTSANGGIDIGGGVQPFSISMTIILTVYGTPFVYTGTVGASSITFDGSFGIDVSAGELVITLDSFDATLQNFTLVFPGLDPIYLQAIETFLAQFIEDLVEEMVLNEVPPLLEDAFAGLDLSFEFQAGDGTITMEADFREADFTYTGGTIWMDAIFETDYVDPDTPAFPGSFFTPGAVPTLGQTTPGGAPYGFGIAMGDDLLNQALHQIYRSGVITFHIDQAWAQEQGFSYDLTTTDLALFFPQLWLNYPDEDVEFWMTPLLPPVIVYDPNMKTIGMHLQMGDLTMDMMVVPDPGPPIKAFTMALAVDIPVSVSVDVAANSLSLAFGTPTVYVDIYDELYDFHDELIEVLAPLLIQIIMPFISDLLGEFPIPMLNDFVITVDEMSIFGALDDYMGIFGTLSYVPPKDGFGQDVLIPVGW